MGGGIVSMYGIDWRRRAEEALGLDKPVPDYASAYDHYEGRRAKQAEAVRLAPLLAMAYAEGFADGRCERRRERT